jgi:hypothetical protein
MGPNHHRIAKVSNTWKRRSRSFVIYSTSLSFCSKHLWFFLLVPYIRRNMRFEVLTVVIIKTNVCWDVTPFAQVDTLQSNVEKSPRTQYITYKNLHKLSDDKIPSLQHSGGGGYSCFVEVNSKFHNTWQVSSDALSYSAWRLVYYILLGQQEMIPQPKRSFRPYTRTALRPLLELWNHPLTVVLSCCSRVVPWCDDEYMTTYIHSCMSFMNCVMIIHGQRSKNRDVGFPAAATQPGRYLTA